MWVNETDNGKQWSMAAMIVSQGSFQIERRDVRGGGREEGG